TDEQDAYASAMPLNHVGGITCTITSALIGGSSVLLAPAFSPAGALRDISERGATVFSGVPTMWTLVLGHESFPKRDTSSVRVAVVRGSNADPTLCAAIVAGFPSARLTNLYGLSEVSGACVLSAPDDDAATVAQTLGTPLDGVQARVIDPAGADVAPGADGELLGRKELFLQGGYNVYPVEVENVLTAHPDVAMAAGIGVPHPVLGEVGRYYVLPVAGRRPSAAELAAFCADRLADYKVPRQFEFVEQLPTTPSGKVAKAELRARYRE
ncbi:MAG TPA: AMP-binding protein, partial [Pseudonocardia sp.]